MHLIARSTMLVIALLVTAGCGPASDGTYPVTGKLLLSSGEPFDEGQVQFMSSSGKTHTVTLKPDGSFQIRKNAKFVGLEPGDYKVLAFETNFGDIDRPAKRVVDAKYGSPDTTDLAATVKEEANVFEFTLDPYSG